MSNTIAMTTGQKGLWYLSQVDASVSAAYNVVLALETSHALDATLLSRALDAVVARHAQLGARIALTDFEPALVTTDGAQVPLREVAQTLQAVVESESTTPFDLSQAPLCRATLVRAQAQNGLVLCIPHVVFDGPSANILITDLAHAYSAFQCDNAPQFQAATWDSAQQARLENDYLHSDGGRAQLTQAVEQLRALPMDPILPMRSSGQAGHAYPSATVEVLLPATLGERVRRFAQTEAISAPAVYLAALQILLWQHSGRNDMGISLPVSCRDTEEAQDAVGYYTNFSVLRTQVRPGASAMQLIEQVSDQLFELLDTRHLPYPELVRQYKAAAGQPLSGDGLMGFNYQRTEQSAWTFGDASASSVPARPCFTKDRVKFEVEDSTQGVRCSFDFDRAAYDAHFIEAMLSRYSQLLQSMLELPETKVLVLPAFDSAQRQRLLSDWNGAHIAYDQGTLAHELFEAQVRTQPRKIAAVAGADNISYWELNQRANALGHQLRAHGAGPESFVAVCVERGIDALVSLLAVLKSGAAYLPLDPAYPPARLAYMLRDADARVVLTGRALQGRLSEAAVAQVVLVEAGVARSGAAEQPNLKRTADGANAAYCIYTSGSTGTPKGVVVSAASLSEHLFSCVARYELTAADRVLQFSSTSFDTAIEQMLAPLCVGATLVLRPALIWSPQELLQVLQEQSVSVADIPALYWHHYASDATAALADTPVRLLIVGGEPVKTASLPAAARPLRVLNAYGPTEATVTACVGKLEAQARVSPGQYALIGRPLCNTRLYIVDQHLRLVPPGVAGEICIAGPRLARGYLNRPDLTAINYVPDPYGKPGERMYRTGDIGRHLPDGQLQFIGRNDGQIKVRGFRIELGEIETALLACPGVREAIVLAHADRSDTMQLAAYVVCDGGPYASQALQQQLAGQLPTHMVPAVWFFLDTLPLSPSGKVDRKALPKPDLEPQARAASYVAPKNGIEQVVAAVWAELLKVEQVGSADNFFVLGGHSLLATQIIARLAEQLGVAVSLRALLDDPTVAGLAACIERLRSEPGSATAQPAAISARRTRSAAQPH